MPGAAEMAVRIKQMCDDHYAREVGRMAYLEARLNLTQPEQPLFARWKQVSLDTARSHETACADRPARQRGAKRPSVLDRLTMEEKMLKTRLSDIQAERPALQALYAALTPDQQKELGHGGGLRRPGMGRMMGGMMGHRGPMGRGPDGAPPPPPPQ